MPVKIVRGGENSLRGGLVVLYGEGGLGKSKTASLCPFGPIVGFDCAYGMIGKGVDRIPITNIDEMAEAIRWAQSPDGLKYNTIIWDGFDFLYNDVLGKSPGSDAMQRAGAAQETVHPLVYDFVRKVPQFKILILNERVNEPRRGKNDTGPMPKRTIGPNVSPKTAILLGNAAYLFARVEKGNEPMGSTLRVRATENATTKVAAKMRVEGEYLKDGDLLRDLWPKLIASMSASKEAGHAQVVVQKPEPSAKTTTAPQPVETKQEPPPPVTQNPVVVDAALELNLAGCLLDLNHTLDGEDPTNRFRFKAPQHLSAVLAKYGNGVPPDGDQKGWDEARAVALDYARGQIGSVPSTKSKTNGETPRVSFVK